MAYTHKLKEQRNSEIYEVCPYGPDVCRAFGEDICT